MGLDGVELLMNVEETFGVAVPDEVAQKMHSVGDLYDFLLRDCTRVRQSDCPTAAAFYLLRPQLCRVFDVPRQHVRPDAVLGDIVGRSSCRDSWRRLQGAMVSLRLPSPRRPAWLFHMTVHARGFAILFGLSFFIGLVIVPTLIGIFFLPIVVTAAVLIAVWLLIAEPVARRLPRRFHTVGELARRIAERNHAWFVARQRSWNESQIWQVLQAIVADTLGVDLDSVTRQARFVEDLGLG